MKAELGYYLTPVVPISDDSLGELPVPIYGLRAIPDEIAERLPKGYSRHHWQVEVWDYISNEYVWINQSRHLIFLH